MFQGIHNQSQGTATVNGCPSDIGQSITGHGIDQMYSVEFIEISSMLFPLVIL